MNRMPVDKKRGPIFITGLYRSGTTLLSRMLNAHPELSITYDNVHFMRFCYEKYNPLNEENIRRLISDVSERVLERSGETICEETIISQLNVLEKITYSDIYDQIMQECCLKGNDKKIWGEKTNVAWRSIEDFLTMFPNGKCLFIMRDPRDVLCSFKRMTTNPWPTYLDAIFASLGAFQYAKWLESTLPSESIYIFKFEDMVLDPEKFSKELCAFFKVDYSSTMLDISSFKDIDGKPWTSNTSYSNTLKGISSDSIGRWKDNILSEELALLEMVLKEEMNFFGYALSEKDFGVDDFLKAIEMIRESDVLKERFELWVKEKKGVDTYPNNPDWQPVYKYTTKG